MTQKIKFDPGYAPIVMEAIRQLGYTYYKFNAIPNLKLKKYISMQLQKNWKNT